MRCIYCLKSPPESTFKNREHVVPEGLGLFGSGTFVIRGKVCDGCNKKLGDELDIVLARDSMEGLAFREKHGKGLNKPKGPQRVKLTIPDDPQFGAFAGLILDKDKYFNEHLAQQKSQVRLYPKLPPRRPVNILREDLEKHPGLDKDKFDLTKTVVFPLGKSDEASLIKLLNDKGIPFTFKQREDLSMPVGRKVGFEAVIDSVIRRAICKIAFNYCCYVFPQVDFTHAAFNEIRSFISEGAGDVVFKYPKFLLAQETERIQAKTDSILLIAEVIDGRLVIKMRIYDLQNYEIPIGEQSKPLPAVAHSMKPGLSPERLYGAKRGSGILLAQVDFDPLTGPFWKSTKL